VAIENKALHAIVDEDGAAILDVERGQVSMLNPTGAQVWQRIKCGDSVATIIADLASETGADIQVIDRDVRGFVEVLKQKGLVQH
jgi:hypothetical protein